MIRCLAALFALLLLALLALGFALGTALETAPLVERGETISPAAVDQAGRLFARNDPRRMQRGEQRRLAIPAPLLDEAVNYLASRRLHARGALLMHDAVAELRLTAALRLLAVRRYVNVRAFIDIADGEARIASAFIGRLPIPAALVEFALTAALDRSDYRREWQLARQAIRRIAFEPRRQAVVIDFVWQPAMLDGARALALPAAERLRLESAQTTLAGLLERRPRQAAIALPELLEALLKTSSEDRLAQRRAALLVLATYLAEKNIASLIPEARDWPRTKNVKLTLHGRYDSAQHFVISAALAAWAGEPAADAIGLVKEVRDARHGSGFSFADLAADRAGSRFGELVASDSQRLDDALRRRLVDGDLAPSLDGLPESLSEREFRRRYDGPDQAAYQQVVAEIERRLAALPLYAAN